MAGLSTALLNSAGFVLAPRRDQSQNTRFPDHTTDRFSQRTFLRGFHETDFQRRVRALFQPSRRRRPDRPCRDHAPLDATVSSC